MLLEKGSFQSCLARWGQITCLGKGLPGGVWEFEEAVVSNYCNALKDSYSLKVVTKYYEVEIWMTCLIGGGIIVQLSEYVIIM